MATSRSTKTGKQRKGSPHSTRRVPSVSLFSGAMGLDLGLEMSGFQTALCVENDPEAVKTIAANRPELPILGDVREADAATIRRVGGIGPNAEFVVVGGPPCQSFSVFGNRAGIEDLRGQLIFEFHRLIDGLRPPVFVMENVRGLLSMSIVPRKSASAAASTTDVEPGSLLALLCREFETIGYRVDCFVVNAVNYGAPQIRERLICIGNRHGLVADFPEPRFSNRESDGLPPFRTLGDAIGEGFVDPCPEVMDFSPRKLRYLAMIPPGGNWRSMPVEVQKESMGKSWFLKGGRSAYWRKLSFAFPSPTVVTMPNHAGTSMCHPTELRAITVGEAAAIQEFPAGWKFVGSPAGKFRQIGNAVPTRLGRVAGEVVQKLLTEIRREDSSATGQSPPSRIVHLRPHVRTRTFWKDGEVFAGDHCYYAKATNRTAGDDGQLGLEIAG